MSAHRFSAATFFWSVAALLMMVAAFISAASGIQKSQSVRVPLPAEDEIAAPPDQRSMERLMQQKLTAAKSLLEGISREDHGMVQESAARMIELSRLEAWERMASPRFVQDTADFVAAAEFLSRMAESRDADGEELGFLRLTMTCTNCHRHVRAAAVAGADVRNGQLIPAGVDGW
ncbi:MAG: hypothetical protein ACKO2P_07700 [Planctomycetota bacterium]